MQARVRAQFECIRSADVALTSEDIGPKGLDLCESGLCFVDDSARSVFGFGMLCVCSLVLAHGSGVWRHKFFPLVRRPYTPYISGY